MGGATRRKVLRRIGTVGLTGAGSISAASARTAEQNLHLRGQIQQSDGYPGEDDFIHISSQQHEFESPYFETNEGGLFTVELTQPDTLYLGYYQMTEDGGRIPAPEKDGSPDIYDLRCCVSVSDRPVNLGRIRLPRAYLLHVATVDESGTPVPKARVGVGHSRGGGGYGSGVHTTNEEGLLQYADTDYPGTELVGDVTIGVRPPADEDRFEDTHYEREIFLNEPRTETFVLEER